MLLKNGLVFLHVPRTGGTTIKTALRKNNLIVRQLDVVGEVEWPFRTDPNPGNVAGHATARMCGVDPGKTFCFVRNPFDWYRSNWAFTAGRRGGVEEFIRSEPGPDEIDSVGVGTFEQYVSDRLDRYGGMVTRLYRNYTQGARAVGRLEHLREDLERILGRSLVKIPRMNKSKLPMLQEAVYPPQLLARVAEAERWALDEFSYEVPER